MPQLMEEYMNANNVLRSVGEVLSALCAKDRPAPFESSRLTSMLQPFMGKDSKVLIMFNLSPQSSDLNVTMNTLKYASSLKNAQVATQIAKRPPAGRPFGSRPNDPVMGGREQSGQPSGFANGGYQEQNSMQVEGDRRDYQSSFNKQGQGNNRVQVAGRHPQQGGYEDRGRNFGRDGPGGQQYGGGNRNQGFGGGQQQQFPNNQMRQQRHPSHDVPDQFTVQSEQEVFIKAGYKPFQIAQLTPQQKAAIVDRERKSRPPQGMRSRPGGNERDSMAELGFDTGMDIEEMQDFSKGDRGMGRSFQGSATKQPVMGRPDSITSENYGPGGSQNSSKQATGRKPSAMEIIEDEVVAPNDYAAKQGKLPGARTALGDEIDLDETTEAQQGMMYKGFEQMNQGGQPNVQQGFGGRFNKFEEQKSGQFGGMNFKEAQPAQQPLPYQQQALKQFNEQQGYMNQQPQQGRPSQPITPDAFKSPKRQLPDAGMPQSSPMNRDHSESSNTPRGKMQGSQANMSMQSPQQGFGFVGQQMNTSFQNASMASQSFGKGQMYTQPGSATMTPSQFGHSQQNMSQDSFAQIPRQPNVMFPGQNMGRQGMYGQHNEQNQFQASQRNPHEGFNRGQEGNFGFQGQNQGNFGRGNNQNFMGERGQSYGQNQPQSSQGVTQSQDDSGDDEIDTIPQNTRGRPQEFQNPSQQRQGNFGYGGQFQGDQGYGYRGNQQQGSRGGYQGGSHHQQFGQGSQGMRESYDGYGGGHQQYSRQGGYQGQSHQGGYQGQHGGQRHQGGSFGGRPQQGMRGGHRGQSNYRN